MSACPAWLFSSSNSPEVVSSHLSPVVVQTVSKFELPDWFAWDKAGNTADSNIAKAVSQAQHHANLLCFNMVQIITSQILSVCATLVAFSSRE
jgi:hypothetical protein